LVSARSALATGEDVDAIAQLEAASQVARDYRATSLQTEVEEVLRFIRNGSSTKSRFRISLLTGFGYDSNVSKPSVIVDPVPTGAALWAAFVALNLDTSLQLVPPRPVGVGLRYQVGQLIYFDEAGVNTYDAYSLQQHVLGLTIGYSGLSWLKAET